MIEKKNEKKDRSDACSSQSRITHHPQLEGENISQKIPGIFLSNYLPDQVNLSENGPPFSCQAPEGNCSSHGNAARNNSSNNHTRSVSLGWVNEGSRRQGRMAMSDSFTVVRMVRVFHSWRRRLEAVVDGSVDDRTTRRERETSPSLIKPLLPNPRTYANRVLNVRQS